MDSLREKDSNRFHGLLLLFIIVYTVWWIAKKIIKQQFGYIKAILDFVHGYCVIIHLACTQLKIKDLFTPSTLQRFFANKVPIQ